MGTCMPSGTYELNECCPDGYEAIDTLGKCHSAFHAVKRGQWGGLHAGTARPRGCFVDASNSGTIQT